MSTMEDATACFEKGYNCSQAVVWAFAPGLGLEGDMALKVSAAFGGGMGMMGSTCGVVTGAMMVLGLRYGATGAADRSAKMKTYEMTREFVRRFEGRNGTILCRELLGFDLGTPEGKKQAAATKTHANVCPRFVRDAVEILQEML